MNVLGLLLFILGLMCGLALLALDPARRQLRAQIRRAPDSGSEATDTAAKANPSRPEHGDSTERLAQADIENTRLRGELTRTTAELQQQIEELMMLQRVDKELSATLNFDNVMMLTMDWAIRRTGATAGVVNMGTLDGTAMYPVAALGYPLDVMQKYGVHSPVSLSVGIAGRAARTRQMQVIADVRTDPDYFELLDTTRSEIAIPMEMRGRVLGVLNLESDQLDFFDSSHVSFLQRLAARAVVAMDNSRLYSEAENRADEMAALYSAGRSISGSLERADVQTNTAQALAAILSVSSALVADYRSDRGQLVVTAVYRLGTARGSREALPAAGTAIDLKTLPALQTALRSQRVLVLENTDSSLSTDLRTLLSTFNCDTLLAAPLAVQDQVLGVALAIEGRRHRQFTQDEMLIVESLTSQAASALRQAQLYEDVRELENMKSEMIRMASHDLRNPLGNVMGYFDLIVNNMKEPVSERMRDYITAHRHSTSAMNSLIEDLLTLERIESERQAAWKAFDLGELVYNVVVAHRSAAELKHQSLTLDFDFEHEDFTVFGSTTQLRQAVTNLVSNGIKYTPDSGKIEAKLLRQDNHLTFDVQDNGYGISKERQGRLFQRFYRARETVTENIPGTGLGLSLVKTVIERHGGEVHVESELGNGSTFGFWLPVPGPAERAQGQAATLQQEPEA